MNLGELRTQARIWLDDTVADYLWSDAEIDLYINEAQNEASIRALLLDDENNADFNISITTTSKRYPLNQKIIRISSIALESRPNDVFNDWYATETSLMLKRLPQADDKLILSVYRLPLNKMVNDSDEPEIAEQYHYLLLHWVCHRAYSKPDVDAKNIEMATFHELEFVKAFGQRQDANVIRKHKQNTNHVVQYADF